MNHYEILGIHETATRHEIRAAYLRLVQDAHPDRHVHAPGSSDRDGRFKRVQEAYEVLNDARRREDYDRHRWIPRPRSAGKAVVTPARRGRHDLPNEWLARTNPRNSRKKIRIYRILFLASATIVVAICVGLFGEYCLQLPDGGEAPLRVEVRQSYYANVAAKDYLESASEPRSDPPPGQPEATTPNRDVQPATATKVNRNSAKHAIAARVDSGLEFLDRDMLDEVDPTAPFLGIRPSNTNFDFHLDEQVVPASHEVLQALQPEEHLPPLQESLQSLHGTTSGLNDDYAASESPQFDFQSPLPNKSRNRRRGTSFGEIWKPADQQSIDVQDRYSWKPAPALSVFDAQSRETETLHYESMPPEFGRSPEFGRPEFGRSPDVGDRVEFGRGPEFVTSPEFGRSPELSRGSKFGRTEFGRTEFARFEAVAPDMAELPRGFTSSAVLSDRRHSPLHYGRQESPLPDFQSSPFRLDTPSVPPPSYGGFFRSAPALPSWE